MTKVGRATGMKLSGWKRWTHWGGDVWEASQRLQKKVLGITRGHEPKWSATTVTLSLLGMSSSPPPSASLYHLHKLKDSKGQVEPSCEQCSWLPGHLVTVTHYFWAMPLLHVSAAPLSLPFFLLPVATQPSLEFPGINLTPFPLELNDCSDFKYSLK